MNNTGGHAYAAIKGSGLLGQLQLDVAKVIIENGPITQGETWSEHFTSRQRHDIGPRFAELEKRGVIEQVGTRACRYTGVDGKTYMATGNLPTPREKFKTKKQRLIDAETFIESKGLAEEYKTLTGNTVNGGK